MNLRGRMSAFTSRYAGYVGLAIGVIAVAVAITFAAPRAHAQALPNLHPVSPAAQMYPESGPLPGGYQQPHIGASPQVGTPPQGCDSETNCQQFYQPQTHPESWLFDKIAKDPRSISRLTLVRGSLDVSVWPKGSDKVVVVHMYNQEDINRLQSAASQASPAVTVETQNPGGFPDWLAGSLITLGVLGLALFFWKVLLPLFRRQLQRENEATRQQQNNTASTPASSASSQSTATAPPAPTRKPAVGKDGKPLTRANMKITSKATVFLPGDNNGVTMDSVIGQQEAKTDVSEVIDFLKNPEKYAEMEARMPGGVMLVGGPGVGKTLLVKAVATECGVPVFAMSGSEFVEKFVGVGAQRVRELFDDAKAHAPSIVFIDEIDAMGGKRSSSGDGGSQEHNQTINQILTEMDGFDDRTGVVVFAATNRVDILDDALLRPKRFDRQIYFHNPSRQDRLALLRLYLPERLLEAGVDLLEIAKMTPNASGAVMENIANEAKLLTVREGAKRICQRIIDEAVQKVMIGARREGLIPSESEAYVTQVHEAGHALVFKKLTGRAPLRFSIIPRGQTGGHVQYDEEGELYRTKEQFVTRLAVAMGGKAAVEAHIDGQEDTGVSADLRSATELAYAMVTEYGMSDVFGPIAMSVVPDKYIDEQMRDRVNSEVRKLLEEALKTAERIVTECQSELMKLVETVRERETILPPEFNAICDGGEPQPAL